MGAQVSVLAVGRPDRRLAPAIREYEERASRYWRLDVRTVKAEPTSRNRPILDVQRAESERLRGAAPPASELLALTRHGEAWSSERLAAHLADAGMRGGHVCFLIGGAFGLHQDLISTAHRGLSLSPMTLPHDVARLVLAEQLYRVGTIVRGEPYHKG
jgi:23S rRNA (pseudouridine1915-N3)-methyltransferase